MPKSHLFIKFKVEFRVKYAAIVPPRLNTLIGFTSSCAILEVYNGPDRATQYQLDTNAVKTVCTIRFVTQRCSRLRSAMAK